MIGVSSTHKINTTNIRIKIDNMKRRERSSSRDSSCYRDRRKHRSRGSGYIRYRVDTSAERVSPLERALPSERVRHRFSSSPHAHHTYKKSHNFDEYSSRSGGVVDIVEKSSSSSHPSYKILCISALHPKASDEAIKDILYLEYKKFGDFSVRISQDLDERVAYVCFRSSEDARDAKHAKPRVIIYDKVAVVEPVYESRSSANSHHNKHSSRPQLRSYLPDYNRHYRSRSPLPDPYQVARQFYDHLPYSAAPLPITREFCRELPPAPHHNFLPHHPLHPAALPIPPPHLATVPPHLYVPPRPFIPLKPPHTQFLEKVEKKDKFPNYLHHVPPEDDPLATRTLFAGNLELSITEEELRLIFSRYGVVEDVDIKRPIPGTGNAYAFVRFKNLDMAHQAKVELSGQYIGKFQCKIGYGKATPTTRIWVGGLGPWTSTVALEREFDRFGAIKKIDYDKTENSAYILYDSIDAATAAVKEMRGFPLGGPEHKLRVDFADIGSRQPRSLLPPSLPNSYSDVASSAGDYRVGVSSAITTSDSAVATEDPSYDSYNLWGSATNTNKFENGKGLNVSGIPPGVTLWNDQGKTEGQVGGLSPTNKDEDWKDDQHRDSRAALVSARSLTDIMRCTTNAWQGALILKSSLFPAKFHITEGDGNIINILMKSDESKHLLKISQRLRLDQAKLEDVTKQIQSSSGYGIFIGLPGPSSSIFFDETTAQCRPLRNLVAYLKQKDAAGVISLENKDTQATGVLYAFPPCQFSADLLKRTAHSMTSEALKEDHLMIVVVKGGMV